MADEKVVVEIRVPENESSGAIAQVIEQAFKAQGIELVNEHPEAEAKRNRSETQFAEDTNAMREGVKIKIVS